MSKGEKIFWLVVIAMLLANNPPIINLISSYAKDHPLILGFPTLWLWLEIWYLLVIITFALGAWKIKAWRVKKEEGKWKNG
jgi:hypothetical protein